MKAALSQIRTSTSAVRVIALTVSFLVLICNGYAGLHSSVRLGE